MTEPELAERMAGWLRGGYEAVLFDNSSATVGYALFRRDPDFIYLRQLFIRPELRRRGCGREAIAWLWRNTWHDAARLRIDVLVGNYAGLAFWRAIGFRDYCVTMEMEPPP